MEYNPEQYASRELHIDSSNVTSASGTATNFKLNLLPAIEQAMEYRIENYSIPHSYLNIDPTSSTLSLPFTSDFDGAVNPSFPNLNYTDTTLKTALETAINAVITGNVIIVFANGRCSFTFDTIQATVSLANIAASPLWTALGFSAAVGPATNFKGDKFYNLSGPGRFYIHSRFLSSQQNQQINTTDTLVNTNSITSVLVDVNSGDQIISRIPGPWLPINNPRIVSLDLSLRYNDGTVVDLQGLDWSCDISIVKKRDNY